MAGTITITTNVTIPDFDGVDITVPSSSFTVKTDDVVEFTRNIDASPAIIYDIAYQIAVVVNIGTIDAIVEVMAADRYAVFVVPPGAHAVLPSVVLSSTGVPTAVTNLAAYTAAGDGRIFVFIAK